MSKRGRSVFTGGAEVSKRGRSCRGRSCRGRSDHKPSNKTCIGDEEPLPREELRGIKGSYMDAIRGFLYCEPHNMLTTNGCLWSSARTESLFVTTLNCLRLLCCWAPVVFMFLLVTMQWTLVTQMYAQVFLWGCLSLRNNVVEMMVHDIFYILCKVCLWRADTVKSIYKLTTSRKHAN